MDEYILDYLKSGKAWLLVGSGPSSAIGYPSWQQLADAAVKLCRIEADGCNLAPLEKNFDRALWYNERAMYLDQKNYIWPLAISYIYRDLGDQAKFQEYQAKSKALQATK